MRAAGIGLLIISLLAGAAAGGVVFGGLTAHADGLQVTVTPPPDRNGADPGNGDNTSCPPGPDKSTKGAPDAGLGDKDVCGDSKLDYFMGEWKFVKDNENVIVREWCCNVDPGPQGELKDFFTFQILTSVGAVETERIAPGVPT